MRALTSPVVEPIKWTYPLIAGGTTGRWDPVERVGCWAVSQKGVRLPGLFLWLSAASCHELDVEEAEVQRGSVEGHLEAGRQAECRR